MSIDFPGIEPTWNGNDGIIDLCFEWKIPFRWGKTNAFKKNVDQSGRTEEPCKFQLKMFLISSKINSCRSIKNRRVTLTTSSNYSFNLRVKREPIVCTFDTRLWIQTNFMQMQSFSIRSWEEIVCSYNGGTINCHGTRWRGRKSCRINRKTRNSLNAACQSIVKMDKIHWSWHGNASDKCGFSHRYRCFRCVYELWNRNKLAKLWEKHVQRR